jgi:transcriptional regulator with XRE-family HTH domain
MKLHEKIKFMRLEKNWSQEQAAEKLKMSLNAYGCMERGETCPNLNRLQQISEIFGVKLGELVNEKSVFNIGVDFNNWYNNTPPEYVELQHELDKARLEVEYLKRENIDLRKLVNLLEKNSQQGEI